MSIRFAAALAFAGLVSGQRPPVEEAWALLIKGEREQAVRVLHGIITTNPGDADARLLLGSVLAEEGERSGSIAQLTEAVRLRPQSAEAHNALGEALNGFAAAGDARQAFEKAVQLNPEFAQAHANLGLVLVEAGEFEAAAKHLDRATALLGPTQDAAYPHYLRAKVYIAQTETQRAALELTQAVSLRPDFAEAWSDLGQARKTLLDDAGALAAFKRAVEVDPEDAIAQYRLGAELLRQGEVPSAILHLKNALRLDPEDQSALYSLQLALRRDGKLEEARQVKQKLAELLREQDKTRQTSLAAVALNNQGASLQKAGNLRGALEKYRAALNLYPSHVGIRVNFAAALLRLGQWNQGISELREAVRRDPGNAVLKKALDDALAQAPATATR